MSSRTLHRMAWVAFLFCWALFPMELPIAEVVHATMRRFVGEAYPLLFVGTLVTVTAIVALLTARVPRERPFSRAVLEYVLMAGLFVALGLYAFVVTIFRSPYIENSARQLVLGYVAPALACLVLMLVDEEGRRRAWLAFYAGYVVHLVLSIVFLIDAYRAAQAAGSSLLQLPLGQQLFMWRYTLSEPWNLYATWIGNANKTSNSILIFLLLSVRLLRPDQAARRGVTRFVLMAYWVLGVATLLILFSRATILLLPVAVVASGILPLIRRWAKIVVTMLATWSIIAAWAAYSAALTYLVFARSGDQVPSGFLGSYATRGVLARQVVAYLQDRFGLFLTGPGTSLYSVTVLGDENLGTHNTFLDVAVESGVAGFLVLVTLMLLMLAKTVDPLRVRVSHPLGLCAVVVLILLMTRELSFAYLYATSLGGLCVAAILMILAEPAYRYSRWRQWYPTTAGPREPGSY